MSDTDQQPVQDQQPAQAPAIATMEQVVQTLVGALQVLNQHVQVTPGVLLGALNVIRLEQETVFQTNTLEIINQNRRIAIEQAQAQQLAAQAQESSNAAVETAAAV